MTAGTPNLKTALGGIPDTLVEELIAAYTEVLRNYREQRWEPAELNGGKLCEVVYTILRGHVDGSFPAQSSKPANMVDACRALEKADSNKFSRSVRIQLPRMLVAIYEIRNNRGVGHVGGDVNANHMDATCVLHMCQWVVAELVRHFHATTTAAATEIVDSVVERVVPLIWSVHGKHRVLDTSFSMKEKTLLLMYQRSGAVLEGDLFAWVEHSNPSVYRRDVLRTLHKEKLIEYDGNAKRATISPKGIALVERELL